MSKGTDKFLFMCMKREKEIMPDKSVNEKRYDFSSEDKNLETGIENLTSHFQELLSGVEYNEESPDEVIKATLAFYLDTQKLADVTDDIFTPDDYTDDGSPWRLLEMSLESKLPELKPYLFDYAKWCYSKTSKNPQMKENPEMDNSANAAGSSIRDRFNKRFNKDTANSKFASGHQAPRDARRGSRGGRPQQGRPQQGRPQRGGRNFDKGRQQKSRSEKNEIFEKKALEDAQQAINSMQEDAGIEKLALTPVNSYFRRLQHQLISDSDLFSKSQGEGRNRCIIIFRSEQSGNE